MLRLSSRGPENPVYRCLKSTPPLRVRPTTYPLSTHKKLPRFPFYKISITLLFLMSWIGLPQSECKKYKKSVICHSTITDFILIYSCIPLFCLGFGIPIASLNSFIFFLNQLICDTPSILKSNFPFSSSLMEQTAPLGFKALVELRKNVACLLWERP